MKPSTASMQLAQQINRKADDDLLTVERLATMIDESNANLIEKAERTVTACKYPTPAINRMRIANALQEAIKKHKPA